ncbi:aminotransferase class III-fold pyridoxal phosphate-dependent enzyme [Paludisphaera rhizosphaerae]|uniref:aminotransferase class III-fold pyridoxal phosphate-dependent enzyme n=1 Tax=Paludisphaera rhizosphaerae TaxID=2711216 RepID=UPI0013EAF80A|nr:aminotransferase class III-fold pyridoxal phosphate-dependent enzyme [Paludisphaera rhizosphaerae]
MQTPPPIETLKQILREREPNLLRLYLNPHVASTCFCLDRLVRSTWALPSGPADEAWQSFLANGFEEALGGAVKLVRYNRDETEADGVAIVVDPCDRLEGFADWRLPDGSRVEFLPGLHVLGSSDLAEGLRRIEDDAKIEMLVLVAGDDHRLDEHAEEIQAIVKQHAPAVVACVDRGGLSRLREGKRDWLRAIPPDVVVFDDSFTGNSVPFGAFTARQSLFAAWNRPGKSTFHSTTFQPNTISTRHFMNVLTAVDPEFVRIRADDLNAISVDLARRGEAFRRYYNPSLFRLIRAAGFATADVKAAGGDVIVNGNRILDFVGGVACSMRGHNPPAYADELTFQGGAADSLRAELEARLLPLTGLGNVLPAVSGGGAVESALRTALVARFPRRRILALRAGFGGKTLFSLTGTANQSYKDRIGPLYAEVHYVDPFAPDAAEQIDALLCADDFAAVILELIQSVGGVRAIPESLIRRLDEERRRRGFLLIVDEVQTGMYRTGPFCRSQALGLTPDLMLLGKGTSDMMFPFSLTLYSDAVAELLRGRGEGLIESIRERYGYELGYRTVINVLRSAEEMELSARVVEAEAKFEEKLRSGLGALKNVRDVRVFGLLMAVELDVERGSRRWLRKRLGALYLLAMLQRKQNPLLAGFCQYEPNTLKITPPLNVEADEIDRACETIVEVLKRPFARVLLAGLIQLGKPSPFRKGIHEHGDRPAVEFAAR